MNDVGNRAHELSVRSQLVDPGRVQVSVGIAVADSNPIRWSTF
jgi:hypothetical protein